MIGGMILRRTTKKTPIDVKPISKRKAFLSLLPFLIIVTNIFSFIVFFYSVFFINLGIKLYEKPLLQKDFEIMSQGSFCAFYEHEASSIHYPDGLICHEPESFGLKYDYGPLLVSKNEILFCNSFTINNNTFTTLFASDWSFTPTRTLLTIPGRFKADPLFNNVIRLTNIQNVSTQFLFDATSGKLEAIDSSDPFSNIQSPFGRFHKTKNNKYEMQFLTVTLELKIESLDSSITNLLEKWTFEPSYCRVVSDNAIYCMFERHTSFLGGQEVVFCIASDAFGNIDSYQLFYLSTSYQTTNEIFCICNSFFEATEI